MKVSDLRGILQYVPRFRERIFVIAIDGEIIASDNFANTLLDIAVLRSLSIKVIVVHGAGHQIAELAKARGISVSETDGTGVTDEATLQLSLEAISRVTNEVMQGLTTVDLRAAYPNTIIAHPAGIIGGKDFRYTGRVEKVDTKSLHLFLNEGIVPVVPPLGFDGEGRTYRVNSDNIAVEIAEAMQAMKIIFLGADEVALNGQIIRQLSIAETEEIVRNKKQQLSSPRLVSKLDHAVKACRSGIPRVHLLNGNTDEALLTEVFSHEGVGTMVYSNDYHQIRRIFKKDVRGVMTLIRQSVDNEELIRRRRIDIIEHLEDFWVLEIDRNLVGCVALHIHPEQQLGELACLHVSKNYANSGYGRKLMAFVENLAAEKGLKQIMALSTRAFAYIQQKGGFVEASPDILPADRRARYEASGRNSMVLVKTISPKGGGAGLTSS